MSDKRIRDAFRLGYAFGYAAAAARLKTEPGEISKQSADAYRLYRKGLRAQAKLAES